MNDIIIKSVSVVLSLLGVAAMQPAMAVAGEDGAILAPQEESALVLVQSYLSVVSSVEAQVGCSVMAGQHKFSLETNRSGFGSGNLGGTLWLSASQSGSREFEDKQKATTYIVYQSAPGWFFGNSVNQFTGNFAFGINGELFLGKTSLISSSKWNSVFLQELEREPGSFARVIGGKNGLEYVESNSDSEESGKWRKKIKLIRPAAEDGQIVAENIKISATNEEICKITVNAFYDNLDQKVIVRDAILIINKLQ